jgi:hypothetical protein
MKLGKKTLRIHRETLRDLSAHQLQGVAGGTILVDPIDPVTRGVATAPNRLVPVATWDCTAVACR